MKHILSNEANLHQIFSCLYEGMLITNEHKRITYSNPGVERISGYLSAELVGKQCCDSLLMHVTHDGECLCDKICPLTICLEKGEICEIEAYLHHKEGHRVPILIRTIPIYDNKNKIKGVAELFRENYPRESMDKELADLKDMATIDPLTGLRNRRYAEIMINSKLNELRASGLTFGLLFIDIDHFKRVNDTYGHDIGDLVLKMLAKTLLNNTREQDVLVRWGGEEIVAVIASSDIADKLYKIADKLRNLIGQSALPLADGTNLKVTVSIGATVARPSDTSETVVKRADQLMYQAKKAGRNCVKIAV
jgi:diguanylate cyclase (GGDEF)-like protein/PAS domain S-box-containing protein